MQDRVALVEMVGATITSATKVGTVQNGLNCETAFIFTESPVRDLIADERPVSLPQ